MMWMSLRRQEDVDARLHAAPSRPPSRRRPPPGSACARPAICAPLISRAIACTASKSPGEVRGKPASMMSTPSRSSWRAISSLSSACQRDARRLLAVAQRRIENDDLVHRSSSVALASLEIAASAARPRCRASPPIRSGGRGPSKCELSPRQHHATRLGSVASCLHRAGDALSGSSSATASCRAAPRPLPRSGARR